MRRAILLAALLSCDKGPPPAPVKAPQKEQETPQPPPRKLELHPRSWVHLRSSLLPKELQTPGYWSDLGVHKVEILSITNQELSIRWDLKERYLVSKDIHDEALISGTLRTRGWQESRTMILPVYWEARREEFDGYALLWLTPAAYRELSTKGETEWHFGQLDAKPEDAALKLKERSTAAIRVNKDIRWFPTIRAETAIAECVVLDDPANPLILSVKIKQGVELPEMKTATERTKLTFDYEVTEAWVSE